MIFRLCFILIWSGLILLPGVVSAQTDEISIGSDTTMLSAKLDHAIEVLYSNPDSAFVLASQVQTLADELKYPRFSIRALDILAYVATIKGDYTEALRNDLLSLEKARNLGDQRLLSGVYNNIGNDHLEVRNFEEAHKFFQEALVISEEIDYKYMLSVVTLNLGAVLKELDQYDGALEYFDRSLNIGEEVNDPEGSVHAYMEIGHVWFLRSEFEKAEEYFISALRQLDTLDLPHIRTQVLDRHALNFLHLGRYEESEKAFIEALKIAEEIENQEQQAKVMNGLALLYDYRGRISEAESYIERSIELSANSNKKEIESESYRLLSEIFRDKGMYEEAMNFFKKHHEIKDSILMAEKKVQISNLELQYDLKMKDLEITALNNREALQMEQMARQETLRNILVVLLGFSIVLMVTLYISGRKRRKVNKLLLEHRDEIQKQKDELSELNKVKDKFFSILAHDLRSPIRSLSGVLRLLESNNLSPEETKHLIGAIGRRTEQTQQLLDNLLEWALIQMEKITVNKTEFNLKESVSRNIELMKETSDKSVNIENQMPEFNVFADQNMIDLVLRNLLSNAIKYSKENAAVNVSAERSDVHVIVHIKDSGIGISEELQPHLLQDTSLITQSGTANEKGTGLGLKISKEFIERNGGEIWLKSIEGKGSIFSFSLPARETNS